MVAERLAELVGGSVRSLELMDSGFDATVEVDEHVFAVEWKASGAAASVMAAAEHARRGAADIGAHAIPLVAVPFMGEVGRERCDRAGVAWLDLSGNAQISAPGLRIWIVGQPNRYKRVGRPSSVFAPKSSRIARWLLMHPDEVLTQREVARATHMDEGYTSRIVAKLEEDHLITRDASGAITVRDPYLLLDAWREDYDFSKHTITKGHVAARSGTALLQSLAAHLVERDVQYAMTGLGAAWLMTQFASFRLVTLYVTEQPSQVLLDDIGFREEERGANVWLVLPTDAGVFHGASDVEEVRCVHPVQVDLDLEHHPERAGDAAEALRARFDWRRTDDQ